MNETTAAFEESSRRTLAAIVFTDIVGSSGLMQENEERALELVRRDLGLIGKLCEKFQGKVLKSTGDGLLMYFDSAVQAVGCALDVQNTLAQAAKGLPAEQVLQHRIGIHLGDVFVSETDVMGDGVNVAARLQGEAEPGGICISQTVYDVVKNRLAVKATYLGPRDLKNIQEAVPVYQILLSAQTQGGQVRKVGKKAGSSMAPWQWLAIGTVAAVLGLAVVLTIIVLRNDNKGVPQVVVAPQAGTGYNSPVSGLKGGNDAQKQHAGSENASAPDAKGNTADEPANTPAPEKGPGKKAIAAARQQYLPRYDYKGMVQWLASNDMKDSPLYERYTKMAKLKAFMPALVRQFDKSDPMVVEVTDGKKEKTYRIWDNEGMLTISGPDGDREVALGQLEPAIMVPLSRACLRKVPAGGQQAATFNEAAAGIHEEFEAAGLIKD